MSEYGFSEGMMIGMAKRNAGEDRGTMVFDWDRAAELIRDQKPNHVEAGLAGDWDYTGGTIYDAGKIVTKDDVYTFLASFWAHPQIEIDGVRQDCWRMRDDSEESADWDADTSWPDSARVILNSGDTR